MNDNLVKVQNISKKFCRDLKHSLWYGVKDLGNELLGRSSTCDEQLRRYEFWALNNINFELKRGECIGLIGQNGAGKSTLLKMLNGLIKPTGGKIEIRGRVGALIELGAGFNPILTGRENIFINGAVIGFSQKEIKEKFEDIISFADIDDFIDMPVQNYSSGMKVRLGFAIASQMEPDLLLIDEVLAVGDQSFQIKCFRRIEELLKKKVTIILVSHSMINIERVCSQGIFLSKGQVAFSGDALNTIKYYTRNETSSQKPLYKDNNPVLFEGGELSLQGTDLFFNLFFKSDIEILRANIVAILWKQHIRVCNFASGTPGIRINPGHYRVAFKIQNLHISYGYYHVSVRLRDLENPLLTYGINGRVAELLVDNNLTDKRLGLNFSEMGIINIDSHNIQMNFEAINKLNKL